MGCKCLKKLLSWLSSPVAVKRASNQPAVVYAAQAQWRKLRIVWVLLDGKEIVFFPPRFTPAKGNTKQCDCCQCNFNTLSFFFISSPLEGQRIILVWNEFFNIEQTFSYNRGYYTKNIVVKNENSFLNLIRDPIRVYINSIFCLKFITLDSNVVCCQFTFWLFKPEPCFC